MAKAKVKPDPIPEIVKEPEPVVVKEVAHVIDHFNFSTGNTTRITSNGKT
jgi:hypothetical protein